MTATPDLERVRALLSGHLTGLLEPDDNYKDGHPQPRCTVLARARERRLAARQSVLDPPLGSGVEFEPLHLMHYCPARKDCPVRAGCPL